VPMARPAMFNLSTRARRSRAICLGRRCNLPCPLESPLNLRKKFDPTDEDTLFSRNRSPRPIPRPAAISGETDRTWIPSHPRVTEPLSQCPQSGSCPSPSRFWAGSFGWLSWLSLGVPFATRSQALLQRLHQVVTLPVALRSSSRVRRRFQVGKHGERRRRPSSPSFSAERRFARRKVIGSQAPKPSRPGRAWTPEMLAPAARR
jgi:hypothetical protein